jgi:acylphosphatase
MEHVFLKITGKVQGIFFRQHIKGLAETLGVVGWVKNMADGSVEVGAEGESRALTTFVRSCKEGHQGADIQHVTEERTPIGALNFDTFTIRHERRRI